MALSLSPFSDLCVCCALVRISTFQRTTLQLTWRNKKHSSCSLPYGAQSRQTDYQFRKPLTSVLKGLLVVCKIYFSFYSCTYLSEKKAIYIRANVQAEIKYSYKKLHFHIFSVTHILYSKQVSLHVGRGRIDNSLSSLSSVTLDLNAH